MASQADVSAVDWAGHGYWQAAGRAEFFDASAKDAKRFDERAEWPNPFRPPLSAAAAMMKREVVPDPRASTRKSTRLPGAPIPVTVTQPPGLSMGLKAVLAPRLTRGQAQTSVWRADSGPTNRV